MKLLILCAAAVGVISGQTMVEAGLGAGRAATTAAPAAGVGKSIAGAFSNLDKTLKTADKAASSETIVLPKDAAPSAPAKTYEDIKKAEVGLAYDELITRFGPPAMEIAAGEGVQKLTYSSKEASTRIEVKDGKVATINVVKTQQQSSAMVFTMSK
jgi:hypothetical protein